MKFAKLEKERTAIEQSFLNQMTYKHVEIKILSLDDLEVECTIDRLGCKVM